MTLSNSSFPPNQTTGHGNMTTKTQGALLLCPSISNFRFERLDSSLPYYFNAALNVPLAHATTFANLVVLFAMRRVTSIRLPSKLLLCSLVLTDLGAGSVVQPQAAAYLFLQAIYPELVPCELLRSYAVTGSIFAGASLLTLAAISLDRYAALFFYLKYQQIVTVRRVCAVLAVIWTFAILSALTFLPWPELWRGAAIVVVAVAVIVISVASIKIYRRLRALQIQPQAPDQTQQQAGNTLNMERYRRTASAMMWICVLLLICYPPFLCMSAFIAASQLTALIHCLHDFSGTLVLLNSFLNPFVYCFRLPDVRREVVKELHKLFCRLSSAQRVKISHGIERMWNARRE